MNLDRLREKVKGERDKMLNMGNEGWILAADVLRFIEEAEREEQQRMSRTWGHSTGHKYHGRKHPGYDYWSKRPGPTSPGKQNKRITHSIERARARALLYRVDEGLEE